MTKSKGIGRGRKGVPRKPYSIKDGMKLCAGPTHPEGGTWLPATEQYFYKRLNGLSPSFHSHCKRCRSHRVAKKKLDSLAYGYVMVSRFRFVFEELERRLGRKEAARRCGMASHHRWQSIMEGKQRRVQKRTIERAMNALLEARINNEVRHRRDIKWGRAARGLPEVLKPVDQRDLYVPTGDKQMEQQRRYRGQEVA